MEVLGTVFITNGCTPGARTGERVGKEGGGKERRGRQGGSKEGWGEKLAGDSPTSRGKVRLKVLCAACRLGRHARGGAGKVQSDRRDCHRPPQRGASGPASAALLRAWIVMRSRSTNRCP